MYLSYVSNNGSDKQLLFFLNDNIVKYVVFLILSELKDCTLLLRNPLIDVNVDKYRVSDNAYG